MANYAVTTTQYGPDDVTTVTAAMEAYIETIDTAKTLYLYTISAVGRDNEVIGVIVHMT